MVFYPVKATSFKISLFDQPPSRIKFRETPKPQIGSAQVVESRDYLVC